MINYKTEIDTVALQIDCKDEIQQQFRLDLIRRCIVSSRIASISFNSEKLRYEIYYANTRLATIISGYSNSLNYIKIRIAGLKRYNDVIDKKSKLLLMLLCGWFNTANIHFRLVELDIAIDVSCPFENVLVVCTRKAPHVSYNEIAKLQYFENEIPTSYIEDYSDGNEKKNATLRSYLYNKTAKEGLCFNITRFELKLQKKYFRRFPFNTQSILNALSRYHAMYFQNLNAKQYIISKYNSYSSVQRREINRLGLERYRLYPNVKVVKQFIHDVNSVYINFNGNIAYHH